MFIGRENELRVLEETYQMSGFRMTVIYGRRRIGKSTLIREFLKGKPASYYVASQTSANMEDFFHFAAKHAGTEKIVLALDEVPYIAEADSSFLSRLQNVIDNILSQTEVYLILCGSAVSFMEKKILSEKSPLFGRRFPLSGKRRIYAILYGRGEGSRVRGNRRSGKISVSV